MWIFTSKRASWWRLSVLSSAHALIWKCLMRLVSVKALRITHVIYQAAALVTHRQHWLIISLKTPSWLWMKATLPCLRLARCIRVIGHVKKIWWIMASDCLQPWIIVRWSLKSLSKLCVKRCLFRRRLRSMKLIINSKWLSRWQDQLAWLTLKLLWSRLIPKSMTCFRRLNCVWSSVSVF